MYVQALRSNDHAARVAIAATDMDRIGGLAAEQGTVRHVLYEKSILTNYYFRRYAYAEYTFSGSD